MELLRRIGSLGLIGLLFAAGVPAAIAQDDDDFDRGSLGLLKVTGPDGRSFLQDLRQAREAIGEERYDDALSYLGRLLTADPSKATEDSPVMVEDYFLVNRDGNLLTSIKTEALRLLDSIPAKALKQYELAHGAEAQGMLDEGFASGNADKLAEVMRRFFHTQAGYRACLALGRLNLEQGRPLSAASYLKRLVATPAAQNTTEPDASVLLAGALLHAGQATQAKETLVALKQRYPTFAIRGASSPAFTSDDEALPWLEKLFGRLQSTDAPTALQWTMFRGNAERNAITSFTEPTSTPRWRVPIANDPGDEQLIAETSRSFQQQGVPSLPSMHALAVRNVVIMRGPDQLVAVNVASGKRVWVYPGQDSATKRASRSLAPPSGPQTRIAQLKQRVWDDAPLGQVASDGELVYFVDGLGDAAPYGSPAFTINRGGRDRNVDSQPPFNKLVAISLKKEGSLIWQAPDQGDDDPLYQAFFLGAPLAVNGQVYAIAEIKGEITLVALDAATGKLGWKQQIGHVENFNVMTDPLRRMAGASPSYADGVLVCPTTAGAVVAIDVATRRLLWGSEYSHDRNRFSRFDGTRFPRYGDRWVDGTATIVEGKVIVTPPDSTALHCLELATGKTVWPAKRREDLLFVAGVHEGTIVLVGKSQIVGIKLNDGQRAWDDIAIDLPSGRGVLDKAHYYQPTVSGMLVVDLAAGEMKQSFTTTRPLGNLATYQDDIISLSDECLAAYPRTDRLEQKIAEALARDPRDPWALARRGELLMHERKWTEALEMLRQAMAQPKPDSAAAGMLAETILALLEEDYVKHVALSAEVEKLIDDPQLSNRYHRIVAMGREKQGDRIGAFRAFLGIDAGNRSGEDSAVAREKLIDLDLRWQARSNRWIASHLASLYRDASEAERREMDQAVAAQFNSVPKNAPGALRDFVERFAFHPLAGQGQLDLAKLLVASGNLLEAEALVEQQASASDRRLAGQATALSAQIMRQAGRWPEALRRYQRAGAEFADLEVEPKITGRQLLESVSKQYDYRQAQAAASKTFARGRAIVEADTRSSMRGIGDQRRTFPVTLLQAESGPDASPNVTLEPMTGAENRLRIRDSHGRDIATINLTRSESRRLFAGPGLPPTGRLAGHLLVVSTGHEVLAIDLLRGSRDPSEVILWRQDLIDATDSSQYTMYSQKGIANPWATVRFFPADTNNRPLGIVSPITSAGLCFIKQKQLYCVDPTTGQTQWLRSDQEPGADLFGDDEYLFVSPHNSDSADVYHMLDGSPAGKRNLAHVERRWATNGRRVLSWSEKPGKTMILQLDDVWAGKNIWTETAPNTSRAWLCSPDEVAIFTLDGKFKIRSLRDAAVKLETQLQKEKELHQLFVLKSSTQYFAAIGVPATNPLPNINIQPAPPNSNQSPLITGRIYAFDAATGKPSWPAPAAVSQMSLPLDQPLDQPVLLFLRNIISRSGSAQQKASTGMLCLDKRTGAVLHEEAEILNTSTSSYDLEAERDASAVRITVPGKSLRIRFTEEPAPPEPPVQNDEAFAGRPNSRGEKAVRPQTNPLEPNFEFSDP
jgi:outer membrane protein assembly factor BamB/tetratricopeptide (TPR) repeat protein